MDFTAIKSEVEEIVEDGDYTYAESEEVWIVCDSDGLPLNEYETSRYTKEQAIAECIKNLPSWLIFG